MRQPHADVLSLPLSSCPKQCNKRGYCTTRYEDPTAPPYCRCHRGYDVRPAGATLPLVVVAVVLEALLLLLLLEGAAGRPWEHQQCASARGLHAHQRSCS